MQFPFQKKDLRSVTKILFALGALLGGTLTLVNLKDSLTKDCREVARRQHLEIMDLRRQQFILQQQLAESATKMQFLEEELQRHHKTQPIPYESVKTELNFPNSAKKI